MTARVGYALSALLLGVGALIGVQYSSATFTDGSNTPAQVTSARDWTPPTVSVDDPGFVVSGIVSVTATAADADTSVATVVIQYSPAGADSWTTICLDTASPWVCSWDTETVSDESYDLRAIATDVDGNTAASATVTTEVANTASVVLDPVPSPVRGTIALTARLVNVRAGSTNITFQYRLTGGGAYADLPGCANLSGPEASCDMDTTLLGGSATYDLRAVGRRGPATYYDFQIGIEVDNTRPTVTVDKASAQADPTNGSPIDFTVVFSEPVTGFDDSDLTLGGTSGGTKVGTVTGSGTTYNVAVTGMTGDGSVTALLASGGAADAVGNTNVASTSTDNSVQYNGVFPTVTIDQAVGQADPTATTGITFTVVFSRSVTGFSQSDVTITGTAGGTDTIDVTGSGTTYTVTVTNTTSGTVIATIPAGAATATNGNPNNASTSTDNTVTRDVTAPTVSVARAAGQGSTTSSSPINFTVTFSEAVTGFDTGDLTITGTAGGTKVGTVTGSGTTYTVAVTGMVGDGTVIASVASSVANDLAGNANTASGGTAASRTVTYDDTIAPTVTINQAAAQADPTNGSTINFTVVFSEPVTGFATGDVTLGGTTTGTKVGTVTGSGTTYNVAVTGMTGTGTVIASIAASRAVDAGANQNLASTSTDNTVTRDVTAPTVSVARAAGQGSTTSSSPINFTVTFSEAVTGFDTGDLTITGTAGGTKVGTVTGSGTTYTVAVTGMVGDGTVIASVASSVANDLAGNANTASGGTVASRTVTYDDTIAPTVTINQAAAQADPTNGSTINFTVVFSEPVTGFATGDVTISGSTTGTKTATVSGSGTTYNVAVTGMTSSGTVTATIAAGRATDTGANTNLASTSTDNTVTRDVTGPTVTIEKAPGQADPANGSAIDFTVTFDEAVTNFVTGDVTITGTAGGTKTATVTGSGTTYNVRITGMTTSGTVIATVAAGRATDALGNGNTVSTSTDNSVAWSP